MPFQVKTPNPAFVPQINEEPLPKSLTLPDSFLTVEPEEEEEDTPESELNLIQHISDTVYEDPVFPVK